MSGNKYKYTGYHGTPKANIDSILNKGYFPSGKNQWFGAGVYFFETFLPLHCNGFIEARNWLIYVKGEKAWAVFCAQIETNECFDCVNNIEDRTSFDRLKKILFEKHIEAGLAVEHFKDRAVFKEIQNKDYFKVIRALVDASKSSYFNYVIAHPQVQICVKDLSAIVKNELIAQGG